MAHLFDGSLTFVVGLVVVDAELIGDQGLQNQVAVLRRQDARRRQQRTAPLQDLAQPPVDLGGRPRRGRPPRP
ncbi:hypothetical protein [Streptacidiphilus sp. EB103A]|uniref:hypothetical protein n=1 Tax=Streptacidiphilus sp. EB103A TaxID=3156275 RepID=UPI003515D241